MSDTCRALCPFGSQSLWARCHSILGTIKGRADPRLVPNALLTVADAALRSDAKSRPTMKSFNFWRAWKGLDEHLSTSIVPLCYAIYSARMITANMSPSLCVSSLEFTISVDEASVRGAQRYSSACKEQNGAVSRMGWMDDKTEQIPVRLQGSCLVLQGSELARGRGKWDTEQVSKRKRRLVRGRTAAIGIQILRSPSYAKMEEMIASMWIDLTMLVCDFDDRRDSQASEVPQLGF